MKVHKVQQGEDMISVALKYGIADWESLYHHQINERLKRYRADPMSLSPGDIVLIPELQPIVYRRATNQLHTITITLPKTTIELALFDEEGEVLAGIAYELSGEGFEFKANTSDSGLLLHQVPLTAKQATLKYWPDKENPDRCITRTLKLGHLNPIEEPSGQQGRLDNLGANVGTIDGDYGPKTHTALLEHSDKLK